MEKPLFIPLKKEYFKKFENGTKLLNSEFRPYGPRWNEVSCRPGRAVTLSLGYGKHRRLKGVVKSFSKCRAHLCPAKTDYYKIYGFDPFPIVAQIEIELDN